VILLGLLLEELLLGKLGLVLVGFTVLYQLTKRRQIKQYTGIKKQRKF
jgi:hypothetical protein